MVRPLHLLGERSDYYIISERVAPWVYYPVWDYLPHTLVGLLDERCVRHCLGYCSCPRLMWWWSRCTWMSFTFRLFESLHQPFCSFNWVISSACRWRSSSCLFFSSSFLKQLLHLGLESLEHHPMFFRCIVIIGVVCCWNHLHSLESLGLGIVITRPHGGRQLYLYGY